MPQKIYITMPHMQQNFIKNHKIIKRDYPEVYKGLPVLTTNFKIN